MYIKLEKGSVLSSTLRLTLRKLARPTFYSRDFEINGNAQ